MFLIEGSPEIDWDCRLYVHSNLCTSYVKVCLNLTRLNVKHFQMFDRSSSSKWKQNFAIIFPPEEAEVYQLVDLLFEQDWRWESLPSCWGSLEEASITSFMIIILYCGFFLQNIISSGTRTKTSWLGWGREGLSWSFKFMILDSDLCHKSSAKFFLLHVFYWHVFKLLKRELGVV